MKLKNTCISEQ